MDLVSITFTPLFSDEFPGDPELGGWRPLPKRFYTCQEQVILSLKEVVRLTAFRLNEFQVRQAIGIMAQRLTN